jgi:hypothetical protein
MHKKIIHNVETGQIEESEFSADELKEFAKGRAEIEEKYAKESEAEQAKQVILDRLGITSDEAKLLLL